MNKIQNIALGLLLPHSSTPACAWILTKITLEESGGLGGEETSVILLV